jgi:hypothetical protein
LWSLPIDLRVEGLPLSLSEPWELEVGLVPASGLASLPRLDFAWVSESGYRAQSVPPGEFTIEIRPRGHSPWVSGPVRVLAGEMIVERLEHAGERLPKERETDR